MANPIVQPWAGDWAKRSREAEPLTHGDPEGYGWEWCKCGECGHVAVCTPNNDFYTRGDDNIGPLVCEGCIVRPPKSTKP